MSSSKRAQKNLTHPSTPSIYIRAIDVCLLPVCPVLPPKWLDLAKNLTLYNPSGFTSFRPWTHSFLPLRSFEATRGHSLPFLPSRTDLRTRARSDRVHINLVSLRYIYLCTRVVRFLKKLCDQRWELTKSAYGPPKLPQKISAF